MFSQTNDYALRVMVHLARHRGIRRTAPEIAAATCVPQSYLSKVLQTLGRAGLITAQRGLHGGFLLERDPACITALQVVTAVDPVKRIQSCPLKLACHSKELCPLHRRIDDTLAHMEAMLGKTTVAELAQVVPSLGSVG